MIIGKKLRELREQKGLLLRQVAASLEVEERKTLNESLLLNWLRFIRQTKAN